MILTRVTWSIPDLPRPDVVAPEPVEEGLLAKGAWYVATPELSREVRHLSSGEGARVLITNDPRAAMSATEQQYE